MSNKTLLVAQREYVENLRTKMFWIGILFVPILIGGAIAVSVWFGKKKDQRLYAVIDKSGWMLEAVEKRAALPDLRRVFQTTLDWYRDEDPRYNDLPMTVQALAEGIDKGLKDYDSLSEPQKKALAEASKGSDDPEDVLIDLLVEGMSVSFGPDGLGALTSVPGVPEDFVRGVIDKFERFTTDVRTWWQSLPPEEAEQFGKQLAKSRYVRVDVDGEGDALLEDLNKRVADEKLFAYFIIGDNPVETNEGCKYVSNNLTDNDLKRWFTDLASDEVREQRLDDEGIDAAVADRIQRPIKFESKKLSETGEEEEVKTEDRIRQLAPVAFVYLLWIAVFSISQMLLTNTIEEKSNRILEVLLSSVSPLQLMIGKIIGICLTGLTVVLSWVIYFIAAVKIVPKVMGSQMEFDLSIIANDPLYMVSFIVYFVLGYMFYAAFLVGIGSVCNSVKEANNLMMPISMVLMMPLLAMIPIGQDPNGSLARILSYIPPFTPFVMMNRAAGPPTMMEYVVTTLLLLVSIALAMWAAAKVFRIGILMTGKAPTPVEIFRWLRAPIGQVPTRDAAE